MPDPIIPDIDTWMKQRVKISPQAPAGGNVPAGQLTDPDQWMAQQEQQSNVMAGEGKPWTALSGKEILKRGTDRFLNLIGPKTTIPLAAAIATAPITGGMSALPAMLTQGGVGAITNLAADTMEHGIPNAPTATTRAAEGFVGGITGEGMGRTVGGVVDKALNPFAEGVTPTGQAVNKRFSTPGANRSSVTPSEVSSSRGANILEQSGRSAMFGGKPFEDVDIAAKKAIKREVDKTLGTMGAGPTAATAPASRLEAGRLKTQAGQQWQESRAARSAAEEAVTSSKYDAIYNEAQTRGIVRPNGDGTVSTLEDVRREVSDLNTTYRYLKKAALRDPEKKKALYDTRATLSKSQAQLDSMLANHPDLANSLDATNREWKDIRRTYNNKVVTQLSGKTPDDIVDSLFVGKGLPATKDPNAPGMLPSASLVRSVLGAGPDAMQSIKEAATRRLIADATEDKSGWILGSAMREDLVNNATTLRPLLGQHYSDWMELAHLIEAKQAKRDDIGRLFWQLRQPQAAAQILAGKPSPSAAIIMSAPAVIARVMTSNNPTVRKWLIEGLDTEGYGQRGGYVVGQLANWLAKQHLYDNEGNEPAPEGMEDAIPGPPGR